MIRAFRTLVASVGSVPARNSCKFEAPSPSLSASADGQLAEFGPQYRPCQSSAKPSKLLSRPQVFPVAGSEAGDLRPSASSYARRTVWVLLGAKSLRT